MVGFLRPSPFHGPSLFVSPGPVGRGGWIEKRFLMLSLVQVAREILSALPHGR